MADVKLSEILKGIQVLFKGRKKTAETEAGRCRKKFKKKKRRRNNKYLSKPK